MIDAPRRSAWLDCLRGVAAAMVFVRHAPFHISGLETPQAGMRAGVVIFFALSGYLLFRPFVAAFDGHGDRVDLRRYAFNRLARILPAYFVGTFALSALEGGSLFSNPFGQIAMLDTPIAVVWSLRVELVFYAFLPCIAMALASLPAARRPTALLAIAGISFAILFGVSVAIASGVVGIVPAFLEWPGAFWQFVPGMLVAVATVRRPGIATRLAQRRFLIIGLVLLGVGISLDLEQYDVIDSVAAGILIAHLISRPAPSARAARVFAFLAGTSYAFYLWHNELLGMVAELGPAGATIAGLALTTLVSVASWTLVEQPAIRIARGMRRRGDQRASEPSAAGSTMALRPTVGDAHPANIGN